MEDDMNTTRKVAIVTGAARGIGLAIARRLSAEGNAVVLTDIDASELDKAVDSIRRDQPSAKCLPLVVDVTSRLSVDKMISDTVAAFGRIDVLVSNAGTWKELSTGPFWQIPNAEWQRTFQVNTEGAFNCAASVSPQMIKQNAGRIVFIGSTAIGEALAQITHYTASKAALIGLMRCAAKELGKNGITVNMVHPGQTDTGGFSREEFERKAKSKFIPKVVNPDDITGIVAFLSSDESGFITAQQINVDGGGVLG
jgi:NAD(P)-dependent dehydrogenase (short-subunit alcohol dehydrogenase family)